MQEAFTTTLTPSGEEGDGSLKDNLVQLMDGCLISLQQSAKDVVSIKECKNYISLLSKDKKQITIKSSPNNFVEDFSRLILSNFERHFIYLVVKKPKTKPA